MTTMIPVYDYHDTLVEHMVGSIREWGHCGHGAYGTWLHYGIEDDTLGIKYDTQLTELGGREFQSMAVSASLFSLSIIRIMLVPVAIKCLSRSSLHVP